MAGCCTGTEIDLKEMRTPGQIDMGNVLGPLIQAGIGQGATPFGGQLSMGPDQAQMAAMNTMMGIGGQGAYQPGAYPTMAPQGGPPGPNVRPLPGGGGGYDMTTVPGQTGGGTPDDPYTVIPKDSLRDPYAAYDPIWKKQLQDPGYRNQVPPGASRNIQGSASPSIWDVISNLYGTPTRTRP